MKSYSIFLVLLYARCAASYYLNSGRTCQYLTTMERNAVPLHGEEWARKRGLVPGYGGFWPGDPNAKRYKVTIRSPKFDQEFTEMVPADRYIYSYFEEQGVDLPFINKVKMCRQGCCTTCAVKVNEGSVKMDTPLGLLKELRDDGYALTCCSYPKSDIDCSLLNEDEVYFEHYFDLCFGFICFVGI